MEKKTKTKQNRRAERTWPVCVCVLRVRGASVQEERHQSARAMYVRPLTSAVGVWTTSCNRRRRRRRRRRRCCAAARAFSPFKKRVCVCAHAARRGERAFVDARTHARHFTRTIAGVVGMFLWMNARASRRRWTDGGGASSRAPTRRRHRRWAAAAVRDPLERRRRGGGSVDGAHLVLGVQTPTTSCPVH